MKISHVIIVKTIKRKLLERGLSQVVRSNMYNFLVHFYILLSLYISVLYIFPLLFLLFISLIFFCLIILPLNLGLFYKIDLIVFITQLFLQLDQFTDALVFEVTCIAIKTKFSFEIHFPLIPFSNMSFMIKKIYINFLKSIFLFI